ncbi:hypothetical protein ACGVWS_12430 [Enterobacteriaceae bacterium LUAb1]
MKNNVLLSIAMTSFVSLSAGQVIANDVPPSAPEVSAIKPADHGGKCASGKCGTAKVYEQAKLRHDPQDKLVRARDGKCGLSGQGITHNENKVDSDKLVSGVCGQ